MFLIRTAFWLGILVLLLPTNAQQQGQLLGVAEATVKDLSGFCGRNPDACDKGKAVLGVFVQKAEFGGQMVISFIANHHSGAETQTAESDAAEPAAAGAIAPAADAESGPAGDTLTTDDRKPAWAGARPSGI